MSVNLPDPPTEYDRTYMLDLIRSLEQTLSKITQGGQRTYAIKNLTTNRSIDLSSDAQVDINSFLLTAINDLYVRGFLG